MPPARRKFRAYRPFTARHTCCVTQHDCDNESEYTTSLDENDNDYMSQSRLSLQKKDKLPIDMIDISHESCSMDTLHNTNSTKLRRRTRRRRLDEQSSSKITTTAAPPPFVHKNDTCRSTSIDGVSTDVDSESENDMSVYSKDTQNVPILDSFSAFRLNYLIVHIAIMLADGLQGTHLYVLYEGYGYSVASLYCLGFVSGAITSPFIGPLVDKIGRKRSAMLYCLLEMGINLLEQYPIFAGLIVSRVVGGITTNLLFSVFESWLLTEHRKRGFPEEKLEVILRDSVIVSNLAAIGSGYIAHYLASKLGPVGPFEGAVFCTGLALLLVAFMWKENYGSCSSKAMSFRGHMAGAFKTIFNDSKILRIGITQGLTEGTLQTFVFLWSPALRNFAKNAPSDSIGLDEFGEPAYGLIFGAFMTCGVFGGLVSPIFRRGVTWLTSHKKEDEKDVVEIEGEGQVRPAAVELLASLCYFVCAILLLTPYLLKDSNSDYAFSMSLLSFLVYEFFVGLYMPIEGVVRSIYMPNESICSLMTMLRVIVNVSVAIGVISTNYVTFSTAYLATSVMMIIAALVQMSLVSQKEYHALLGRFRYITSFSSK